MRIVVTGCHGKIGRVVTEHLARKHIVVGVSRRADPLRGATELRAADLTVAGQAHAALAGADAVVHLAAIPFPDRFPRSSVYANNTLSTYNVLESAALHGIRRVVFASSIAVLGPVYGGLYMTGSFPVHYLPIDESHPVAPVDPYGLSKLIDETACASISRRAGLEVVALRFSWVVFPEDLPDVLRGSRRLEAARSIFWSYTDHRDAVRAVELALEVPVTGFHPLYITAADTLSLYESRVLARECSPERIDEAERLDGHASLISFRRARELIGYVPLHSWRSTAGPTMRPASCRERSEPASPLSTT